MNDALTAGEQIECDIALPAHNALDKGDVVCLRCRAVIVRVERTAGGTQFGVACRIEDYHLVHGSIEM